MSSEQVQKEKRIFEIIKSSVDDWNTIDYDDVKLTRQTGLTNITYKVALKEKASSETSRLIYRYFCKNHVYIDRNHERAVFDLMEKNQLGPRAIYQTEEYRLEEFIDGIHPNIKETNTQYFRNLISYNIAQVHNLQPEKFDKTPILEKSLDKNSYIVKTFKQKMKSLIEKHQEYKDFIVDIDNEIDEAYNLLPKKSENNVKFCHNDLLNYNIFKLKSSLNQNVIKLMFIDYEYSGYNYRAFDLANFFVEQTFDYNVNTNPFFKINTYLYPKYEQIRETVMYYLYYFYCIKNEIECNQEELLNSFEELKSNIKKNFTEDIFLEEVEEIIQEINICAMFAHFFWIVWGIISADRQDVQFNYFEFARQRFQIYLQLKEQYLSLIHI
eukprot:TRINITY_DN1484_c0_g2_i3.p1 TRINITY_DN1484_c0_g2~~TRINITY_DN1484_c0_g2_i3.p1  ORF type:complete len:383 (-),score=74.21 TRINITY_DN1484_c0_g2_i3:62-1210(-)